MLRLTLSLLALAQSAPTGDDPEPSSPPAALQPAPTRPNPLALAQYNAKRSQTPRTAQAQWELALWCENHGLEAESRAALALVVELDPSRVSAWKRLGCKEYHGQWLTPKQIEQAKIQEEANQRWAAEFKAIHRHIHGGRRQAEAEAALARIDDPRAIPALYREFADRSAKDQIFAVQVLGQIRGSVSSKTLATLSVYGASSEVRRLATETLRGRDPSEYAGFLVSLLAEILKYEVRPVAGPGSPGILFVEGQRFNVRRFYAPPPAPHVGFRAGDMITYDSFGSPVILRNVGVIGRLKDRGEVMAGMPMRVSTTEVDRIAISPRQLQKEALKGALVAESQLENDVAQIEAQNQIRTMFNEVVTRALKDATGQDIDNDPKSWKTYVEKLTGYGQTRPEKAKPTFDQAVPLAYQPRFAPIAEDVGFLQTAVPDS